MTYSKAGHAPNKNIPGLAVRQAATRLLSAVIDKKTSLDGLTDNEHGHPQYLALDMRDRSLCRAILGASLRHRADITHALNEFLDRPLPQNALSLTHLLHVGAAQILYLDIPDHATIDLAVTAAKIDPRNQRFSGLVNAVLRKFARNAQDIRQNPPTIDNVPQWFGAMLVKAYGKDKAQAILNAQEYEPPLDLTVKSDAKGWAEKLNGTVLPNGSVRLSGLDGPLSELLGYDEGEWWVQDVAAALPAYLMGNIQGKKVADLCAAPGGKTAQLALQGGDVTAIDLSFNRLKRLNSNMKRLNFHVKTWVGNLNAFQPDELFDAVLLDAPCSSTGTIRRHPDILWTKDHQDVLKLAELQYELLNAAIDLVKKDGLIVFANCSLAQEEGEMLVQKILSARKDITLMPILPNEIGAMEHLISSDGLLRTTPADLKGETQQLSGMDGFFAARFRKVG